MISLGKISSILLAGTFLFASCSKDDEEVNPGPAPELPPAASMEMDFSNFSNDGTSGGREMTTAHWNAAVVTVGFWNLVLTGALAVPVASFKAAISKTPEYDRDRKLWVWKFDHNVVGRTYSFELTGELAGDKVEWNMYASGENGFQNVLWYSGEMTTDGTSGHWILNKDGNNPTEFLRIDWSKENDEVASIKYENIEEASVHLGAYIEYGKTDGTEYNRFYNVVGAEGSVKIEWNKSTGVGKITTVNGTSLCWDSSFEDIECS